MTVTGVTVPSCANNCVMPTFLPMIPLIIVDCQLSIADLKIHATTNRKLAIGNRQCPSLSSKSFNLDIDARGQVELHQRIDCLRRRIENIHQALMRSDLKLLARFLIDVRRAQDGPLVLDRRQWNRPGHAGAGALRCFDNLCRRLIEDSVIVGFEPDSDFFVQHDRYARFQRASFLPELTARQHAGSVRTQAIRPPLTPCPRRPYVHPREWRTAILSPSQSVRSVRCPPSRCLRASPSLLPAAGVLPRSRPSSESKTAAGSP